VATATQQPCALFARLALHKQPAMDSTARRVYYTLKRRKNNRPSKILIVRRLQSVAILARIPQALLLEQHNAVLFRM